MADLVAIQMISNGDVDANFQQLEAQLNVLQVEDNTLVVLPECFACYGGGKRQLALAEEYGTGPIQARLQRLAKQHKVWIVSGTHPLLGSEKGKFTASSLLIDNQGQILTRYDKIHLFDVYVEDSTGQYDESAYTQHGQHISVIDTPFGKVGIAVCYDLRFAALFHAMGQVDVLVLPSAFTQKTGQAHWFTLLQARAIENQCYVVAANQGGLHENGRTTFGHSCIISPWGKVLTSLQSGQGAVKSSIDTTLIHTIRSTMPVAAHNKFRSHFE